LLGNSKPYSADTEFLPIEIFDKKLKKSRWIHRDFLLLILLIDQ